ncbi:MAG: NAD(P)-binding domain-containing protein [Planctomycetaceae bacterium]|nr:NAD(P)-binding domain-containing protein [Planctomycetaceae bacterium]
MSWVLLACLVLALGLALAMAAARRTQLARMAARVHEREQALSSGAREAVLQEPVVDLSRCLGCGTCVRACPEEGVLALVHGQALVVNAARCVGHRACERECPVGAIQVGIAGLATRRDVPNVSESLEALGTPGLFLAGEVTAHALIKTAIEHGTAVAAEVARRGRTGASDELDLCIVGVGPAGLACALEAKRQGLRFLALDQELAPGGTVAKYPRRKLVVMQPVELPLHGTLDQREYTKEELVELWQRIVSEQQLPLRLGETFLGVERERESFVVRTERASFRARQVCLAIGRRGSPRRLGVKGEELPKVAYSLLDAHGFQRRRVLVVGGGDSAVEAALALAEQPGNEVTLSYRRDSFFRLRARNEQRLRASVGASRLALLMASDLREVRDDAVELDVRESGEPRRVTLPNDDVLVMAGGTTPFELLSRVGVSFDPAQRAAPEPFVESGPGLVPALAGAFVLSLLGLVFALWHADYYFLPTALRPEQLKHELLRPGRNLGLAFALGACALIVVNLLYLARRRLLRGFRWGSLRGWMSVHVGTGVLAFLCALLHAAMAPRDTVGGHALWGLAVLLVTGAIGRYFYAWVPRAANGRELAVEELRLRLGKLAEQWDRSHWSFVERVRRELAQHIDATQWRSSFLARVVAVVKGRRELERALQLVAAEGRSANVPQARIHETLELARVAWRTSLAAAHLEDLRAVIESWRYLHRWVAVLVLLLIALHVLYVLAYGSSSIGSFAG